MNFKNLFNVFKKKEAEQPATNPKKYDVEFMTPEEEDALNDKDYAERVVKYSVKISDTCHAEFTNSAGTALDALFGAIAIVAVKTNCGLPTLFTKLVETYAGAGGNMDLGQLINIPLGADAKPKDKSQLN